MLIMDERQALARNIRELVIDYVLKENFRTAHYNLQNLQATVAARLQPISQEYKRSSRSIPAEEYSPFYETYVRVNKCFGELEALLRKSNFPARQHAIKAFPNQKRLWQQGRTCRFQSRRAAGPPQNLGQE
jgi:hypothetical protein